MKLTKFAGPPPSLPGKAGHYLLVPVFICLGLSLGLAQQIPSQDPGHKADAEIAGIKFSVPRGFNLAPSSDPKLAFMRHEKYDLALFVVVPGTQISGEFLTGLSNSLASQLFPQEKGFEWKMLPNVSGSKVSKRQTGGGNTKGFNGKTFVQTDYIAVETAGREVLVGYITKLGREGDAKFLFNLKGPGGFSMPGWYAQAHILASVTGERYEEINPGTVIRTAPPPKKY